MWADLGVLAPSLIVCAAFCAGVYYLLRGELAPKRRDRSSNDASVEFPSDPTISVQDHDEDTVVSVTSEADEEIGRADSRS